MNRVQKVNEIQPSFESNQNIVYLMIRDYRIEDNHALLLAQSEAIKHKQGLIICSTIIKPIPNRQFIFLKEGLKEIEIMIKPFHIPFIFLSNPNLLISKKIKEWNVSQIIMDFSPLKEVTSFKKKIPISCLEVDTHNIVPVWIASNKQEYAARTIRPKINQHLSTYAVEPKQIKPHPIPISISKVRNEFDKYKPRDLSSPITWAHGGTTNGLKQLNHFLSNYKGYALKRNKPLLNFVSNLSPWLHFGFISSLRCYLECKKKPKSIDIDSFLEEVVIRKELSDNFCYYNQKYDSVLGLPSWALATLESHKHDERSVIYSYRTLLNAKTHDVTWNFSQEQLLYEGKIHGYLRMYWCKKIIEWTKGFRTAYTYSITLNDDLSIDGNDPNGFVGVLWCFGLHDRPWVERPILGKVRYLNQVGKDVEKELNQKN